MNVTLIDNLYEQIMYARYRMKGICQLARWWRTQSCSSSTSSSSS